MVEIQVENNGSDADLKLVLIWVLFSHVGFLTDCKFFILKVMFFCKYTFRTINVLRKLLHACPYCFCNDKGLATCRLGGVISARKVLFWALFEIGFECFLRTNHIN